MKDPSLTPDVGSPPGWAFDLVDPWTRYREYRRRQAAALLALVPREGIRPLYRHALDGMRGGAGESDSLALLLSFCERLLPLPPFDLWLSDQDAHPAAYLDDESGSLREESQGHVTVETRCLEVPGGRWWAALDVQRDENVWRGHITFHPAEGSRSHATGEIFSESTADAVRDRFMEFDDRTLTAFLRSSLP